MTREFNFTYQVPEADCIAGLDVKVECECKGFMHNGEPVVIVLNSKFIGLGWADFWSANATANKLTEAAKKYFLTIQNN